MVFVHVFHQNVSFKGNNSKCWRCRASHLIGENNFKAVLLWISPLTFVLYVIWQQVNRLKRGECQLKCQLLVEKVLIEALLGCQNEVGGSQAHNIVSSFLFFFSPCELT